MNLYLARIHSTINGEDIPCIIGLCIEDLSTSRLHLEMSTSWPKKGAGTSRPSPHIGLRVHIRTSQYIWAKTYKRTSQHIWT